MLKGSGGLAGLGRLVRPHLMGGPQRPIIWVCGPRVRYWGWRYINDIVHIKILYNHAFIYFWSKYNHAFINNNDIMFDHIMVERDADLQMLTSYTVTNTGKKTPN